MGAFTFIDLFAGIGGFRQAMTNIGGDCVGFSEIAPDAIAAYCDNYGEPKSRNFGDITKIEDLPKHDIMTAGVPCQSWSIAGKNLGFDDDRGQLWNDTLYLLNKAKPKAFIFENVKGLADPRNQSALSYILNRIKEASYYAEYHIINSFDYGVPQNRVRIYIIGFKEKEFFDKFTLPTPTPGKIKLADVLEGCSRKECDNCPTTVSRWSLSCNEDGINDYFLFNDLRNGATTIHSWDIIETTEREKKICMLLLTNRRKSKFGNLDGNPLSLNQFRSLDNTISEEELNGLVDKGILKKVKYLYRLIREYHGESNAEQLALSMADHKGLLNVDDLKVNRIFKLKKVGVVETLSSLEEKGIIECIETRFDFKNGKISTGLFGINRIFLPSSNIYPTLVASDTNDYITEIEIDAKSPLDYKNKFMELVYRTKKYRQITKSEACRIQGFPKDFRLPESRPRWMKLIGNSVSVPVIQMLAKSIARTGVFGERWIEEDYPDSYIFSPTTPKAIQLSLFD